jgi:hypothetical protein
MNCAADLVLSGAVEGRGDRMDTLLTVLRKAVGNMRREVLSFWLRLLMRRGGRAGEEDIGDCAGGIEGGGIMRRRFAVTVGNACAVVVSLGTRVRRDDGKQTNE